MKRHSSRRARRVLFTALGLALLMGVYALLPIRGQVIVLTYDSGPSLVWPEMRLEPSSSGTQGSSLGVTDNYPWAHVLLTLDGKSAALRDYAENVGGTWTWHWSLPANATGVVVFYHDCQTGCVERGRFVLGTTRTAPAKLASPARALPTKLGVVFAGTGRDWHGRSGWDVELTYVRLGDRPYWGADDLAERVQAAAARDLRVLVRVDYAQGQSVPAANDQLALTEYLQYLQRLSRDDRLKTAYGFVIGSNFNARDSNLISPSQPVTPEWYARLFNGYGEPVSHSDNVVQTIRAENAAVQVLVGPVQPWNLEQDGKSPFSIDVPWLNYMNTLVAALDAGTARKASAGFPLAAPDGFAVQAPGRLDADVLQGKPAAEEPRLNLTRQSWQGAQSGFRVYRDWLGIINSYPTMRGLPLYITSANTYTPDQAIVPAQNYVRGWLTSAFEEINNEVQVRALIWFLDEDRSGDVRWDWFSLSAHPGRMIDAADEFDALLQR